MNEILQAARVQSDPAGISTTIGLDLGDRWSRYGVVDRSGAVIEEDRVRTSTAALERRFRKTLTRFVLEAGTHSPWVSRLFGEPGFKQRVFKAVRHRVGPTRWHFHKILCVLLLVASASWGCKSAPRAQSKNRQIGWRPIDSWTGRGDTQTDSFNIESTQWRIKWETQGAASPGAGRFHVVVHSAVSGRSIAEAVEHQGDGKGIAYVTEDPRLYHLVIDSSGVDWSIKVEEAVGGEVENAR